MTQKIDKSIVEKIEKLLALGQSPNEHEAKLAIENANRLLTKYNLTMLDLNKNENNTIQFVFEQNSSRVSTWKNTLLKGVCITNFCDLVISRGSKVNFIIIGKEFNISIVKNLFEYLSEAIELWARKNGGKGTSAKNSYKVGMAFGLVSRLAQIKQEAEQKGFQEDITTTALVVKNLHEVMKKENETYMANNFNIKTTSKAISVSNGSAYNKGYKDSSNISLNQQLAAI